MTCEEKCEKEHAPHRATILCSRMMRFGVQGWGSEGDLRPLVALAGRLRQLGHELDLVFTVVDDKDHAPLCLRYGVTMRKVPEDIEIRIEEIVRDAAGASPTKVLEAVIARAFRPYVDAMYEAGRELCKKSDVVIGTSSSWPLKAAAIAARVPYVVVDYMPVVPSRVAPPTGLANWGPFNGLRWVVLNKMLDMAFLRDPSALFEKVGLPKPKHAAEVVSSGLLDLHAASPTLCPPAPDWGASHVVCGDLIVDETDEPWTPSPALAEFLDAGSPPILMSLGSMELMAPERARDLLASSARAAKVRAIVQTKRAREEGRDGDVFFAPWIPHRRIVGRCAAIVHHGGAGTTHAAARAGLPSVVLPFIIEQRLWGQRLAQLGAGVAPRSFWKASPDDVARDIHRAVAMKDSAAAVAAAMAREERGVDVAARAIERVHLRAPI
jgi:sterol 3beta-glucosyltransferase